MVQPKIFVFQLVCLNLMVVAKASLNLALHKTTKQSTTWYYPSSKAVDGNRNSVFEARSCTHTSYKDNITVAWWWLDLGFMSEIKQIKIFYRSGDFQRLNGYVIDIYSNATSCPFECYRDPCPDSLPATTSPVHNCSYLGRFINMSVERRNGINYKSYDRQGAVINLCEFEVYGCQMGFYGNDSCNIPCGDGCIDSRCDPDTGKCNCTDQWKGEKCIFPDCPQGYYGVNCTNMCPDDCAGDVCDPFKGTCIDGCTGSKFGTHCNLVCPLNCGSSCDQITGKCIAVCKTGYYSPFCNYSCPSGCKNEKCDFKSGDCTESCKSGFNGKKCNGCALYLYGAECRNRCGNCLNQSTCDPINGSCSDGCDINYEGERCNTYTKSSCAGKEHVFTIPIVGSVFGTLVAEAIFVLCIFLIRRILKGKRTRKNNENLGQKGIQSNGQDQSYEQLRKPQIYTNDAFYDVRTSCHGISIKTSGTESNYVDTEISKESNYEEVQ